MMYFQCTNDTSRVIGMCFPEYVPESNTDLHNPLNSPFRDPPQPTTDNSGAMTETVVIIAMLVVLCCIIGRMAGICKK